MRRFLVYDHLDAPVGEISENDVISLERREEINGEHSLEVTTTQILQKGWRVVYKDGRGTWREYVVAGVDEAHEAGETLIGTYYCVWSLQHDLQGVTVSVMPGVQTPVTAGTALEALLATQMRWGVGTVTQTTSSGASMYDRSAWQALGTLVEVWGGEIGVTIGVSVTNGVISRNIDLYSKLGNQTAKRRYDFGADVRGIKRTYDDAPLYCRISPRGAGEESGDGYGRKITIKSVNSGKDYLEYSPMVDACKLPNGYGGFQYPTLIVENSECKTPADLKAWGQSVLEDYCTPHVTYEVDVLQTAVEGVDALGVSLGDSVHVVDGKFGNGVRLSARVVALTVDEMNERNATVKLGHVDEGLHAKFDTAKRALRDVTQLSDELSSAAYIESLLNRINTEINATGGYTYITQGQGLRTYDVEVSDPLVGSEASSVVELKGGTIRIANSKTAQGVWNWRTVFTSGHIAAELVTAVNVTAGMIKSANENVVINLDSGNVVFKNGIIRNSANTSYWDLTNNTFVTDGMTANGMTANNMNATNMSATGTITTTKSWSTSGNTLKRQVVIDDGAVNFKGTQWNASTFNDYGSISSRYHNIGGSELAIQTPGHIIEYAQSVVTGIKNSNGTHKYGSEPGGTVVTNTTGVSKKVTFPFTYNFSASGSSITATNGTITLDFVHGRCVSISASGATVTNH